MRNTSPVRILQLPVATEKMYGAFSPDRSRLLTGGDGAEPKVHIWDVETGNCLQALLGHKGPVAALNVPLSELAFQFGVPISFEGLLEGRIAYGVGGGTGGFGTHSAGVIDASASFSFDVFDANHQAVNGAGITGDSGTVYTVSQVPEPSPRSSLLTAVILFWIWTRWPRPRRHAQFMFGRSP